jgi:hypothetical protein
MLHSGRARQLAMASRVYRSLLMEALQALGALSNIGKNPGKIQRCNSRKTNIAHGRSVLPADAASAAHPAH